MRLLGLLVIAFLSASLAAAPPIVLEWDKNLLTIHDGRIPGGKIVVNYLEAYCRAGSTDRDWRETVVGHTTELIAKSDDGTEVKLKCRLKDGVIVDHTIRAGADDVAFALTAHNPTDKESQAHWAQPCIRVNDFTGGDKTTYVKQCFLFLDGKLARMPTPVWTTTARYIPGQVWRPKSVDANDVNPRPLNPQIPSSGLVGCFSGDEKWIMATAFEPHQELFQGVAHCVHADFRLGGLKPGETKQVRGKIYLVPADVPALVKRYERDFPEQK
ncbi:MAG: hypothetical protein SH850_08660 [Planctomycetaceae bacterium]|nr:hypothetical protein [Planctomycetaceae bacterium]